MIYRAQGSMTTELVTTGRVSSRISLQSGEKRHELVEADSRLVRGQVRAMRTISVFMMISVECADRCGFAHSIEVMHEVCRGD